MSAAQSPIAYFPEIRTLADVPAFHGRRTPERTALCFEGRRTSYAELERRTAQVANGLIEAGVGRGARVAWLGKNSDHFFEIVFGTLRAGGVLTPVNWRLAPPEVVYITNDAEAEVLFVDADCFALVDRVFDQLGTPRCVIAMQPNAPRNWETYEAWRDRQSSAAPSVALDPEDVALQLYTSGTTGRPKGVQLSHRSFFAYNEYSYAHPEAFGPDMDWNRWSADDVSLVAMPVFHISGSGWGVLSLYAGALTVVLREFDVGAVLDSIGEFGVTKAVLVPTTIQMVLEHPRVTETDFSSITDLLYGASPIPLPLLERAVETLKCGFVQLYGMTETCGAFTYLPRDDHKPGNRRMRSAGKAVPGADVAIMPVSEERILPSGEEGEICVRTPAAMKGYWKLPEETARVIQPSGWLRTGDAGVMDEDGFVYIRDRVKDMIVSGGENVYPAEVESALYGHPDVSECAVIGVPDDKWGEAVKAIVIRRPGTTLDAAALIAYARQHIAGYKAPKSVDFVDVLPRNASGKLLKNVLRKPFWEGRDRQVN